MYLFYRVLDFYWLHALQLPRRSLQKWGKKYNLNKTTWLIHHFVLTGVIFDIVKGLNGYT